MDVFKKMMMAGVGMAVVTKDRVESSLQDLVDKGKLSAEEAKEMSDRIVNEGEEETKQARAEANKLFDDMLHRAHVVTQDQLDALEERIKTLEGRWNREFPNDEDDERS